MSELAKLRRSKGFSQRGLAKEAGVSSSSVYEIEVGRRRANPSTLRKIAGALGVEIMDLLEEEERPKASAAPPSLAEWLEERCGHAYLTLSKEELEERFDAQDDEGARAFGLEINEEYNVFVAFPTNATTAERVLMRRTIRDSISSVAAKHQLALLESGLLREYTDALSRAFELARTLDAETA